MKEDKISKLYSPLKDWKNCFFPCGVVPHINVFQQSRTALIPIEGSEPISSALKKKNVNIKFHSRFDTK